MPQAGWRGVAGAVLLLLASISFLDSHLFWPRGVFTMLAIGVGMLLLGGGSARGDHLGRLAGTTRPVS